MPLTVPSKMDSQENFKFHSQINDSNISCGFISPHIVIGSTIFALFYPQSDMPSPSTNKYPPYDLGQCRCCLSEINFMQVQRSVQDSREVTSLAKEAVGEGER